MCVWWWWWGETLIKHAKARLNAFMILLHSFYTKLQTIVKSLNTNLKHPFNNIVFWTWIAVSRPLEPVPARKFHIYFESVMNNTKILQPEGEVLRNNEHYTNQKIEI